MRCSYFYEDIFPQPGWIPICTGPRDTLEMGRDEGRCGVFLIMKQVSF